MQKFEKLLIGLIAVFSICYNANAQRSFELSKLNLNEQLSATADANSTSNIEVFSFSDEQLSLQLLNMTDDKGFGWSYDLWLDENTVAENNKLIYSEFFNYNMNLWFELNDFQFVFQVVSLFKSGNSDFAIEPSLDEATIAGHINFEHVAVSQFNFSIIYTF